MSFYPQMSGKPAPDIPDPEGREDPGFSRKDPREIPEDWGAGGEAEPRRARVRRSKKPTPVREREAPPVYRARTQPDGTEEQPASRMTREENRRGRIPLGYAVILVLCTVLLTGCVLYAGGIRERYQAHRRMIAELYTDTLPRNVYVDDIPVGGLTRQEASALLTGEREIADSGLSFRIRAEDGGYYELTSAQIPFSRDTEAVLAQAAAFSWQGMHGTEDAGISPAEYRYRCLKQLESSPEGAHYYTRVTYSRENIYQAVSMIAENENREAADSEAVFDPVSRGFSFTQEVYGRHLDAQQLYDDLIFLLDSGVRYADITAGILQTAPSVTRISLMNSFVLLGSYTTQTTSDEKRNTNIRLACEAISGQIVRPGQRWSFNSATGERTEKKGYQYAAAIADGTTVDEIGGGVCQVSSTLFNAAAAVGLEIVERSPHAWPSTYVEKGRDATVNWPSLDFVFRNNRSASVYITATYHDRSCTVELYGTGQTIGERAELETALIAQEEPPGEPVYIRNTSLPAGTRRETRKARTGYTVETYRVWYQGDRQLRRELLCTSEYKMMRQTIEYN